jgi:hypothetical protein
MRHLIHSPSQLRDDDDYVSDVDLRVEPHVLDYAAMNAVPWLVRTYPPMCMNLRNESR